MFVAYYILLFMFANQLQSINIILHHNIDMIDKIDNPIDDCIH